MTLIILYYVNRYFVFVSQESDEAKTALANTNGTLDKRIKVTHCSVQIKKTWKSMQIHLFGAIKPFLTYSKFHGDDYENIWAKRWKLINE